MISLFHTGEPNLVDQIIMALGLGSMGQMVTPGAPGLINPSFRLGQPSNSLSVRPGSPGSPGVPQPLVYEPLALTTQCDDTRKVCQHVTVPHGK